MSKQPIKIYYDGSCKMCTAFAEGTKARSPEQELIDVTTEPEGTGPAPYEKMMDEMHLVDSDGTVRTGADAVLTSMTEANKIWWPLSRLVRIWPISLIARFIYRRVSKNRYLLSGFYR